MFWRAVAPDRPVADVLYVHDEARLEPGPPATDLQRRARALGRPFWWAAPVRTAGALLAAAGFVVAPSSAPGIALMVCGALVVVTAVVVRRSVGPRYGAATLEAGLPVPPERADELCSVASAIGATLDAIADAGETGVFPPRTRRIHAAVRSWDRTTERLRGHWLRGDDARWRAAAARLADRRDDAERWRRDVDEHVRRHAVEDPPEE